MNKLTTIWRLENSEGEGPFGVGCPLFFRSLYRQFDCDYLYDTHVSPEEDERLFPQFHKLKKYRGNEGWVFGFESLEKYARWFPHFEMNKYLMDQGYILQAYDVDPKHVLFGDAQLVFCRTEVRPVCCNAALDLSV